MESGGRGAEKRIEERLGSGEWRGIFGNSRDIIGSVSRFASCRRVGRVNPALLVCDGGGDQLFLYLALPRIVFSNHPPRGVGKLARRRLVSLPFPLGPLLIR